MNRIVALYINEMIKISRKTSILIMILILFAGVFGLGGLMKIQENAMTRFDNSGQSDRTWLNEEMKRIRDDLENQREETLQQLAALDPEQDQLSYQALQESAADLQDQIDMYQTAIDEEISLLEGDTYLSQSLYRITEIKRQLRQLQYQADSIGSDESVLLEIMRLQDVVTNYESLVHSADFQAYLQMEVDNVQQNKDMSEKEKELQLQKLEFWQKMDPSGGLANPQLNYQVSSVLQRFETLGRSLNEKLDYSGYSGVVPLTPDKYDEIENQQAVLIYQIENDYLNLEQQNTLAGTALESMLGFGSFMVVLMVLILAGGAISQEIATGSIKSLIIAPVKRWKIFLAKLLSLCSVGILGILALYLIAQIAHGVFFGFGSGQPYIYAAGGQAASIGFYLYQLLGLLVRLIDVIVFMAFALMLSVLTRNTAAAVGISMAAFFGSSLAKQIMVILPRAEWVRFLPFNHLGLLDKFFPFRSAGGIPGSVGGFGDMVAPNQTSLIFSLLYLTVLLICLLYTALDSFNRRDIK